MRHALSTRPAVVVHEQAVLKYKGTVQCRLRRVSPACVRENSGAGNSSSRSHSVSEKSHLPPWKEKLISSLACGSPPRARSSQLCQQITSFPNGHCWPHPHMMKWKLAALMWVLSTEYWSTNCIWTFLSRSLCNVVQACEHVRIQSHFAGTAGSPIWPTGLKQLIVRSYCSLLQIISPNCCSELLPRSHAL